MDENKQKVYDLLEKATKQRKRLSSWEVSGQLNLRADLAMTALRELLEDRKIKKLGEGQNKWYETL